MAIPEHSSPLPHPTDETIPTPTLADIQRQLELADDIENPIERFLKRDSLLEQYDQLQADIDAVASSTT
ncbi:MAG: hypothetical protein ABI690_30775 [Chloroflexota bacterium]